MALDAARRAEILPYVENLRDRTGIPVLYISHAISEVARLATTLVLIDAGRVTRAGALEDLLSDPASAALLDPSRLEIAARARLPVEARASASAAGARATAAAEAPPEGELITALPL